MVLSFAERRAQTRTLRNVYSWLQPQSRLFDDTSDAMPIEQFEKLCGPIQDAQFDADLAKEIVLNPCLNMAEGFLIEYTIVLGYKPTDFTLPDGYSFVSRLPHGDPGKELDLTISVLQTIINGNEALSEMAEKLNKLIEEKSTLDNNESELPKIYATLADRIEKYDAVTDEEIQDFIDQIEKDGSYQTHLYLFNQYRPLLLKGANHVKFIQNSFSSDCVNHVISKAYFDSVFDLMESIVSRLSNEQLEIALTESKEHFAKMLVKKRVYISDLKLNNNSRMNVVMFTARVLLRGPKAACDDLSPFVRDRNVICMKLFADMQPPLYKVLLESESPALLQVLFSMRGYYASNNFIEPMDCLVRPGTFPLHKLLKVMLKDSQNFKPHMAKLLHCHVSRDCIEKAATTEQWEETAQALITVMSILCGDDRVDKALYMNLLGLMRKSRKDKSLHEEWLVKYEKSEAVIVFLGLKKKKKEEEPVKRNEEEVKINEEKKEEGETKKMTERMKEKDRIKKEERKKKEEMEKEKNKDVEKVKVENKKELKTEVEKEEKKHEKEEVKDERTNDNEKEVKVEQQVEKEEEKEEMKEDTATTLTENKEATTDEENEDLDATADTKGKEDTSDEIKKHGKLDAPSVTEDKDETSDGDYADPVTEDKEATSDEDSEDTDAPTATEDKDETSSSEYEDIDAEHVENQANMEKMSLSEASTQEVSEESDKEFEDIDGVAVDKEKGATEEENAEAKLDQNKDATKEDKSVTEQEVRDEGAVEEGNAEADQMSSSDDDEEFVLIDSSSDSDVEPIVEFPESDDERLYTDATQSSSNSQEGVHGFTNSINNMDQIGKTE